jgi:hypothetical protein
MMRRSLTLFVLLSFALTMAAPASAGSRTTGISIESERAQATSPEQQLVDRFAPIVYLRTQPKACDRDAEGYFPAPIETVLGNPDIVLKHAETGSAATDPIVVTGPTAQDLAGKDDSYYLDFPGHSRSPGCTYETSFKKYAAGMSLQPTTYAHIVIDEENHRLVIQYWLWYYFNDWNNTHESDWEMVQVIFDASSVAEALVQSPIMAGYAQHGGGEKADWDDTKLLREGDRLIVYPTAGSHASHYDGDIYIGWGEGGTGVGCDNSTAPSTRLPLNAILIPDTIDPAGPFAWLLFEGTWGERQPWEYNGPTGPNLKDRWGDPIAELDDWRDSSLTVPGNWGSAGVSPTDLFCGLTKAGSRLLLYVGTNVWLLAGIIIVVLSSIGSFFYFKRAAFGAAFRLYFRHIRTFILIGLLTLPIGIFFNFVTYFLSELPPFDWLIAWTDNTAGSRLLMAAVTGGVQQTVMVLVVAPPVIQAVKDIRDGIQPNAMRSLRLAYTRFKPFASALLLSVAALQSLLFVVIGLPLAFLWAVRWQFIGQAIIVDGAQTGRQSLRDSKNAVVGKWWRVLSDSILFQFIAIIPGPIVGVILMLMGRTSVNFVNTFSAVVYAITVPISVIGLTLAYVRYHDEEKPKPALISEN